MLVYRGKIDFFQYAENEDITVVFPEDLAGKKPALLYWQWTVDAKGNAKQNVNYHGFIDSVKVETNESICLGISDKDYYRFDGEMSADGKTLTLTMTSIQGMESSVMTLNQLYPIQSIDIK